MNLRVLNQPRGCGLSAEELAAQTERYRVLMRSVRSSRVESQLFEVELGDVDEALLRETLEIERGCCSFFEIEHDPPFVRFRTDAANAHVLATFASALSTPA
jgi:hypothetical protein